MDIDTPASSWWWIEFDNGLGYNMEIMKNKKTFLIIIVVLIVAGLGVSWVLSKKPQVVVTNFEECVAAGNPIMESYPPRCQHQGVTFTEEIIN